MRICWLPSRESNLDMLIQSSLAATSAVSILLVNSFEISNGSCLSTVSKSLINYWRLLSSYE